MVEELFDIFEGPVYLPYVLMFSIGFFASLVLYRLLAGPFRKLWGAYLRLADAFIDWAGYIAHRAVRTIVPATLALVLLSLCFLSVMPSGSVFPLVRGLEGCHLKPEDGVSYAVYRLGRAETLSSYVRECLAVGLLIPSLSLTSWNMPEHPLQRVFACQRA
jgi:hypothetical protein